MAGTAPTEHQIEPLRSAAFMRGSIVTSYAQVEFLLADFVFRCHANAGKAQPTFPYSVDDRIKAVRSIVATDERFAPYRKEVGEVAGGLLRYREMRDMMAHGMQLLRTRGIEWHQLDYRMFRVAKGKIIEVGQMNTDVVQMANAAKEIGDYAQSLVTIWRRIYLDLGLEPVA